MDLALSYCHLVVGDIRSGHVSRKLVDIRLYITKVSVVVHFFPVERWSSSAGGGSSNKRILSGFPG